MRTGKSATSTPAAAAIAGVRRADVTAALLLVLITAPVTVPGRSEQLPPAAAALLLPVLAGLAAALATTWCRLLTACLRPGHQTIATIRELAAAERCVLRTATAWTVGVIVTLPVPRTWTSFWFASSLLWLGFAAMPRPTSRAIARHWRTR